MIENRLSAIGVSEIEARVSDYLSERNLEIDGEDLLDRLFSRSGVLIRDESRLTACFKHRSFAEFFCAAEWLHTNSFSVDVRALDPYWATVYFFSVGQLSDCEDTLKAILALEPLDFDQRVNKVFAAPSYLLAGHMTPYRIVENALPGLFLEAARVYVDISERRVASPLSALPPIPVLYLLQFVMRDKYGFQFFRRAVETTAREIVEAVEEDKVKAYALFLLGVVGIELDFRGAMQFLAKEFKPGELPIGLAVAVRYESERAQKTGMPSILRSFNKRVHTLLKGNRSLRATLDNMFRRPIGPPATDTREAKARRLPRS